MMDPPIRDADDNWERRADPQDRRRLDDMKHVEKVVFEDCKRQVTASVELPDEAVVLSQPGEGALVWAQNAKARCPERTDHPAGVMVRCDFDSGHDGPHRTEGRVAYAWTHDEHNCVRYRGRR